MSTAIFEATKTLSSGPGGALLLLACWAILMLSVAPARCHSAETEQAFDLIVCHPSSGNVRNTEASMVQLRDGRLLIAYTRFGKNGGDNDPADIAGKISSDGGRTWSDPFVLQRNDGRMNVMSASLVRLSTGEILLGYLRKNSPADCSFWVRKSKDDAKTWGEEVLVTRDKAYHVVNNDRIVELKSGRLLVPAADYGDYRAGKPAVGVSYISHDGGQTWRRGKGDVHLPGVGCQEPGVVEMKDGRVCMIIRTSLGYIYSCSSSDGGETWSDPEPTPLRSPTAPASIKLIPGTDDLLVIWNNSASSRRVPLTSAISRDAGKTWTNFKDLERVSIADEEASFAYTSILFTEDKVYLTYWTALPDGLGLKLKVLPSSWFSAVKP